MRLHYDEETKVRLRHWRDTDPKLFVRTYAELELIKINPRTHGSSGSPHVPRLVVFGVRGRDDEYVITWELPAEDGAIYVVTVSTIAELQQRSRLK